MSTSRIVFDQPPGAHRADAYRAGACNIGPAEIARRRTFGRIGLVVSALVALALLVAGAPAIVRLLVGLPVAGSAIGLIQARLRFCAAFGFAGLRNFGPVGHEQRVADAAARRADRGMALRIIAAGSLVGLAAGVALALIPR
jgi:hypothetical protein